MRTLGAAGLAVVLCLMGVAPSAQGSTLLGGRSAGMANVPTADTGPAGQTTLGVVAEAGGGARAYLRYGVTDDLELGVAVGNPDVFGEGPAWPVGILARYRLLKEHGNVPALAAGIEGTSGYIVASHRLPGPLLRAHVGVRSFAGGLRVFTGVNATLNPVTVRRPGAIPEPIVTVGVDYDGLTLSTGATLQFSPWFAVDLGVRDKGALQFVAGASISPGF
ncbi:MAG: hypothetical protein AB1609_14260 [Bacillota bacterium]